MKNRIQMMAKVMFHNKRRKRGVLKNALFFMLLAQLISTTTILATLEKQVEEPLQNAINIRQKTQKGVEKWQDDRNDLNANYTNLKEEISDLREYRNRLQKAVVATRKRLAAKKRQLAETEKISEEISPFLEETFAQLGEVSKEGPPFLQEERSNRLARMKEMMSDPSVTVGEKYRRLMEALQIEAEYGFTAEVYQQEITVDGEALLVKLFRLGRLNLFYLTMDGRSCGGWNEAASTWQKLDERWLRGITSVIAMARKEEPVGLVELPIGVIAGGRK